MVSTCRGRLPVEGGEVVVSSWHGQMSTYLYLVPLLFPPSHSHWLLQLLWWLPYVSGGRVVVVWWREVVDFRMLVEFELHEFHHMTLMHLLKMRWYFKLSLICNQSHGFNLCVEVSISPLFSKNF